MLEIVGRYHFTMRNPVSRNQAHIYAVLRQKLLNDMGCAVLSLLTILSLWNCLDTDTRIFK